METVTVKATTPEEEKNHPITVIINIILEAVSRDRSQEKIIGNTKPRNLRKRLDMRELNNSQDMRTEDHIAVVIMRRRSTQIKCLLIITIPDLMTRNSRNIKLLTIEIFIVNNYELHMTMLIL